MSLFQHPAVALLYRRYPLLVGVALLALTGCVPPSAAVREDNPSRQSGLEVFQRALDTAPAGATRSLSQTPWGPGVMVQFHPPYAAASGRRCRRLTVEPRQQARPALACREDGASPARAPTWQIVRLLQINGRPVLHHSTSLLLYEGGAQ
ncbi:DVU3141 family protein [Rhabdochromatium marinum]|uniref:DVU3141 family protein n=1 Tax=Rhabdochromatium marinum TaxID=48729 RepID=UPI0019076675|nr:DVU3141 family protein [Rhabdochromatium marinum]MBK1649527.1 hypothetical protein [Rhabdochromatium marinum]